MGGSPAILAERYGVSQSTISSWRSGRRSPGHDARRAIHADGGPEPGAWDEPLPARPLPLPQAPTEEPGASPEGTRDLADRLYAYALRLQAELERTTDDTILADRVRLLEKLAATTSRLGQLTGAAIVNERQILDSPAFARVESAILGALRSLGAEEGASALRAVADALDEMRGAQ